MLQGMRRFFCGTSIFFFFTAQCQIDQTRGCQSVQEAMEMYKQTISQLTITLYAGGPALHHQLFTCCTFVAGVTSQFSLPVVHSADIDA